MLPKILIISRGSIIKDRGGFLKSATYVFVPLHVREKLLQALFAGPGTAVAIVSQFLWGSSVSRPVK